MVIIIFQNNMKINIIGKNKVIIYNYQKLVDLNEKIVNVDNVIINGKVLKIIKMDDDLIEINGEIEKIIFE